MKKLCSVFLIILVAQSLLHAQDERFGKIGQYLLEGNYQFGRIIPHNSRFKTPVTGYTHSFEVGFYKQTLGDKPWQRKLHYPELGVSFTMAYNHDQQTFGNAYMLIASAKFWLVRSRYIDFFLRVGTGLALTPTHFDLVKNDKNVAIGSLVNSADEFRLGLDFKLDPHIQLMLAASLTHYSDARTQLPNLGVNVPALTVGIRYFPVVNDKFKYNRDKAPKPIKRHEIMARFTVGITEAQTYNGPKYPIYIGTVNYAWYSSVANKVLAGVATEFDQGAFDLFKKFETNTKYSHTATATTFCVFVGDELMLGKLGISCMLGVYAFNPQKYFPMYTKLGLNYYFISVGKKKTTKFFVSAGMKTHILIAQYSEFGAGVAF